MKTVKVIIAAAVLAGVLTGGGVVPAGAAPPAGVQVVQAVSAGTEWEYPGYGTNRLNEELKAVAAYRSFWLISTEGKPLYVAAGSELLYGKYGTSKTVSFLAIDGGIHMANASVKYLNKKTVSIPIGRAKVVKASKVHGLGYKRKIAGRTKKGECLSIYSLALNGKTLVEFKGERAWVKTNTLKAQTASVRNAITDAKLHFSRKGVMKKISLRMEKGSKFVVQGEVESKIKGSSESRKFVRASLGWIKQSDSVLFASKKSILTSSGTMLG